jgi:3'-phosphoadenosine 5'-phosphosulfate sulfotransferase (PAPS reductase)/FAD synthetase
MPDDMEMPSVFYFADTGDEPDAVYQHVAKMRDVMAKHGIDLVDVKRGKEWPLSRHIIDRASRGDGGISMIPMFVSTKTTPSPIRRGCTQDYKVKPIEKAIKEAHGKSPIYQWFGISADESQRMKDSQKKYRHFWYPLVEMGWKRSHCVEYLKSMDLDPPRSACFYCPFHSDHEWKRIGPEERAKSAQIENKIHAIYDEKGIAGLKSKPHLHRTLKPIGEIDFYAQRDLFYEPMDDECFGVCGV